MPLDILTNRYDNNRSGVNSQEAVLTPENVDPAKFGKLFTRTVDGDLYGQPLIVNDLIIDGVRHSSVVFLATSRNFVYCYDAEDPNAYVPLWTRWLGPAVPRDEVLWEQGKDEEHYLNFGKEIGITSTPVIAREGESGTLYVVAKMIQGSRATAVFNQKLYALDLVTGRDRVAPARIEAALPGRPNVAFNPKRNLNRPGLLLQNGVLYLAFGSHDDAGEYYGWILAYDAATLQCLAAYNTAPDWGEGGVWQSGTGLAGDAEDCVYAVVGNGKSTDGRPKPDPVAKPEYGNALLKLKLDRGAGIFEIVDWFTTMDVFDQNDQDVDLIGGPVLFQAEPNGERRTFLLGGGKDGKFYLADRGNLGHWTRDNSGILQADKLCEYHIHGAPVVWRSARGKILAYVWSEKDALKMFRLGPRGFRPAPKGISNVRFPVSENRMPGGILSLSWDGSDPESAIVWASHPTCEDAMNKTVAGTLRAFKATDMTQELWNSDMDPAGDDRLGSFAKFSPPVVANGKVYIGTFSRELAVYGRLDEPRFDLGDFELRDIGPNVDKSGYYAAGRYFLKLSGAGIGVVPEGFLFANREHNLGDSDLSLTVRFDGFNVDHLAGPARGGLIMRGGFAPSDGMAALIVDRDGHAFVLARDQPDETAPRLRARRVRKIGRTRMPGWPTNLRLAVADADEKGHVRITTEVGNAAVGAWEVLADFVMKWDVAANAAVKVGMFVTEQNHAVGPRPGSAPPGQAKFSKVNFK
jgi:hypothetical protein